MTPAPVVVHPPAPDGGRQITLHREGHDAPLGLARSDHDLIVFLEAAGVIEPENVLDDPQLVEWRGAPPHQWHPT
ncbi:hypothetical protein [Streptomyces subrutilus]|uniref:Uncharacterized protein n=1 Tax=Streptomyces subrutilus TaxID=36818 RepID=A0A1E5Q027_9ACTN|nr:hypothetical protein [Streptomyces subrutilus]OEJ35121.1 hypothetical protein BGK67_30795 [Streptomyces subrutilus]